MWGIFGNLWSSWACGFIPALCLLSVQDFWDSQWSLHMLQFSPSHLPFLRPRWTTILAFSCLENKKWACKLWHWTEVYPDIWNGSVCFPDRMISNPEMWVRTQCQQNHYLHILVNTSECKCRHKQYMIVFSWSQVVMFFLFNHTLTTPHPLPLPAGILQQMPPNSDRLSCCEERCLTEPYLSLYCYFPTDPFR